MKKVLAVLAVAVMMMSVAALAEITIAPVDPAVPAQYGVTRPTTISEDDLPLLSTLFAERDITVWTAYFEQVSPITTWSELTSIRYQSSYTVESGDLKLTLEGGTSSLVSAREVTMLSIFFDLPTG